MVSAGDRNDWVLAQTSFPEGAALRKGYDAGGLIRKVMVAIVGVNGEIEHGSAFIHTLRFGDYLREAVKSAEFIPFINTRAVGQDNW